MKPEVARRRIESFAKRFGEAHLIFAYHAAFPLALTPDLLYRLWANFQRDIHGKVLAVPWIAVADLLLSSLCEEVGQELYEMDTVVRNILLSRLKEDVNFGQQRINELSDFLLVYVRQQLNSSDPDVRDFAQAQRWTALAYTRPSEAARELALALKNAYNQEKSELLRVTSLVETFTEPLAEFEPLLVYARGIEKLTRGDLKNAALEFNTVSKQGYDVVTAGVTLSIPEQVLNDNSEIKKAKNKTIQKAGYKITSSTIGSLPKISWNKDQGSLPDISCFYGRARELEKLGKLIENKDIYYLNIYGMPGIGKTSLILKFVKIIKNQFEYIIYHSLHTAPKLDNILLSLMQFLPNKNNYVSETIDNKIEQLGKFFQYHRCLVILDDWDVIFRHKSLIDNIQDKYKDYYSMVNYLLVNHTTFTIVISRESIRNLPNLHCFSWHLTGLNQRDIEALLKDKNLIEPNYFEELFQLYKGNPLATNMAANVIRNMYNGKIAKFLKDDSKYDLIMEFKLLIENYLNDLSDIEIKLLRAIATTEEKISLSEILDYFSAKFTHLELISAIYSLKGRCLLEINMTNDIEFFSVEPIVKHIVLRNQNP